MDQCPNCNRTNFNSKSGFSLHVKSCKAVPQPKEVSPKLSEDTPCGFPLGHLAECQWAIADALEALREGKPGLARFHLEKVAGYAGIVQIHVDEQGKPIQKVSDK